MDSTPTDGTSGGAAAGASRRGGASALRGLLRADAPLRRNPLLGHGLALAAFGAALALRVELNAALPPGFPYLTFFPAVILTTFLAGLWPGVLCAVLSGLAAWYAFIPPANTFELNGSTALALGFYIFICTVDILLIHGVSRTVQRLHEERRLTAQLYDQQRTMFQELQHRVANSMSFVASILYLQKGRVTADPASAVTALDSATARIETMSRIHRRLYDPASADLPFGELLDELCRDLLAMSGVEDVQVEVSAAPVRLDTPRTITLALLVTELVTNALKHAFTPGAPGRVQVRLTNDGPGFLALEVADDGRGLGEASTAVGGGLGARIAASLAGQLGGVLEVESGPGVSNRVRFPA